MSTLQLPSQSLKSLGIIDRATPRLVKGTVYKAVLDPVSGFMVSTAGNDKFGAMAKTKFVEYAEKLFPNLAEVCKLIGISTTTFRNHLAIDPKLAEEIARIREEKVDRIEGYIFDFAADKKNFMDRIAVMRAYRGEIYNPKSTVTFEKKVTVEEASRRSSGLANAIDVEVIASSAEILEGEVVESSVPEPAIAGPAVTSPSAVGAMDNAFTAMGAPQSPGLRDPLSELADEE